MLCRDGDKRQARPFPVHGDGAMRKHPAGVKFCTRYYATGQNALAMPGRGARFLGWEAPPLLARKGALPQKPSILPRTHTILKGAKRHHSYDFSVLTVPNGPHQQKKFS